jgi:hypothetical protein
MYERDLSFSDTVLSFKDYSKKRSVSVVSEQSSIRSRKSSNGKHDLVNYISFRSKSSLSIHLLDVCSQEFSSLCKNVVPSVSYMNINEAMSEFLSYWVDPIFRLYFLLYLSNMKYQSIFVYLKLKRIVFGT